MARKPAPTGDYETRLLALRDLLSVSLLESPAYARAALARQLVDVLGKLEALHPVEVSDRVDDIANARAARRARAASRRVAEGDAGASGDGQAL
jgi:hypothetical protein